MHTHVRTRTHTLMCNRADRTIEELRGGRVEGGSKRRYDEDGLGKQAPRLLVQVKWGYANGSSAVMQLSSK